MWQCSGDVSHKGAKDTKVFLGIAADAENNQAHN